MDADKTLPRRALDVIREASTGPGIFRAHHRHAAFAAKFDGLVDGDHRHRIADVIRAVDQRRGGCFTFNGDFTCWRAALQHLREKRQSRETGKFVARECRIDQMVSRHRRAAW